jgi:hypothetical protein
MITAGSTQGQTAHRTEKNSLLLSIRYKTRTKTAAESNKELKSQQVCGG